LAKRHAKHDRCDQAPLCVNELKHGAGSVWPSAWLVKEIDPSRLAGLAGGVIASETFGVVLVTAPDIGLARRLAKAALEANLVACANLVPAIESHYWWEGKLESSEEVLAIFKTRQQHIPELERVVREIHPYDTPEFVALPLSAGSRKYLAWLADSTM